MTLDTPQAVLEECIKVAEQEYAWTVVRRLLDLRALLPPAASPPPRRAPPPAAEPHPQGPR